MSKLRFLQVFFSQSKKMYLLFPRFLPEKLQVFRLHYIPWESVLVYRMERRETRKASNILNTESSGEDLWATGDLVFNLSHPRVE